MLQITSLIDLFDDSFCRHFPSQHLFTMSLLIPIPQIPLSSGLYVLQLLGPLISTLANLKVASLVFQARVVEFQVLEMLKIIRFPDLVDFLLFDTHAD